MSKKKPELDKLNIDELIDEIKDKEQIESEDQEKKKEERREIESPQTDEDKKEKKSLFKNKKIIFFILWILLFIISMLFAFLAYKEKTKIVHVYSIPIIINTEVIYLSKEKKEEIALQKQYHSYNFNFQFAFEFNGINSKKILYTQVTCLFKSKYEVNLNDLYAFIKSNITKELETLTKDKFLEEIPNYQSKISVIIQNNIIQAILKVCPDLKKEDIMKTFNFAVFRIT